MEVEMDGTHGTEGLGHSMAYTHGNLPKSPIFSAVYGYYIGIFHVVP